MNSFENKYRIESSRLPTWDYSNPGMYFVTICAKNHIHYFGSVSKGMMNLSPIGEIIEREWHNTDKIRKNVLLDEFVIMPNHLHGIIRIVETDNYVETHSNASLLQKSNKNSFGPQKNNLSSIIRGFKSACTKSIRAKLNPNFAWQARFYDHIISSIDSLEYIQNYIKNNPSNWDSRLSIFGEDNSFINLINKPNSTFNGN